MPSSSSAVPRLLRALTAPVPQRSRFVAIAALVIYGDLVTKRLAVALWSAESYPLAGTLVNIEVVYNRLGAFSTSLGQHTWELNVIGTIVAVLLAMASCRRLALVDDSAPATMGLIVGAGLGNLASLMSSSGGVPDFLTVAIGARGSIALNVADVAALLGIAGMVRLVALLVMAIAARARTGASPLAS